MYNVNITGLTRISNPKPNKNGVTILAYFDCRFSGLALIGCAFVRRTRNRLNIWPPKVDSGDMFRRGVVIADDDLRQAMLVAVQAAYRALGGTDGEGSEMGEEGEPETPEEGDDLNGLHRFLSSGAE